MTHYNGKLSAITLISFALVLNLSRLQPVWAQGPGKPTSSAIRDSGKNAAAKKQKLNEKEKTGSHEDECKTSPLEISSYNGQEVLDPSRFFGAAAMGYAAAKSCSEVVSRLFCYCGCDISDDHKTLVDCFTSMHGVDCHICQEEAIRALKMHRDNVPLPEIQKAIDEEYSSKYPWKEDSPAYKAYKASRLWKAAPEAKKTQSSEKSDKYNPSENGIKEANGGTEKKDGWIPIPKKGARPGACCTKGAVEQK